MRDRNRHACKQPERNKSSLAVRQPIILIRIRQPVEHVLRIGKVDAVIAQIDFYVSLHPM
jgi:hypothetical protein